MITVVMGGSGSGKSEYAENLVLDCSAEEHRYYIATMQVYGAEGEARVERHRRLRAGKGFRTLEHTVEVQRALAEISEPERSTVLLECVSNLVANEMFDTALGEQGLVQRVTAGILQVAEVVEHLVIVTNNVFEDGCPYDEVTLRYIEAMGQVNCELAQAADRVIEVVVGIPLEVKEANQCTY